MRDIEIEGNISEWQKIESCRNIKEEDTKIKGRQENKSKLKFIEKQNYLVQFNLIRVKFVKFNEIVINKIKLK